MPEPLKISSSRTPLYALCPPSVLVPETAWGPQRPEGRTGTCLHTWIGQDIPGQEPDYIQLAREAGVSVDEMRFLTRQNRKLWDNYLAKHFPDPQIEKQFEARTSELPTLRGRIDVYSVVRDEVRCLDWKSNESQDINYVPQLKSYAYLLLRHYPEATRARAILAWVRHGTWDVFDWQRAEIEDWWQNFSHTLQNPKGYNPGKHCGYCPRALECPARAAMNRSYMLDFVGPKADHRLETMLLEAPLTDRQEYLDAIQAEMAAALPTDPSERGQLMGRLRERIKVLEPLLEMAKEFLRTEVEMAGGSLPVSLDQELRLRAIEKRTVEPVPAWPVLRRHFDEDELLLCMDLRKGRLEQLVRSNVTSGKQAAVNELFAELEAAQALTIYLEQRLELRKIEPQLEYQP